MTWAEEGQREEGPPPDDVSSLRTILLAVVLLGIVGLAAELVLLEHWDSPVQWLPFATLALGLTTAVGALVRPTRRGLRAFQAVMVLFVAVGALGLGLHYRDNMLFELEMDSAAEGLILLRRTLFGATPFLAPGALAQTGLVGLAAAFRHPALRDRASRERPPEESGSAPGTSALSGVPNGSPRTNHR